MPPFKADVISLREPKTEVLRIMNKTQGEIYWSATCKRWMSLLVRRQYSLLSPNFTLTLKQVARNEFVRIRLHLEGLSTSQYKVSPKESKRFITDKIGRAFLAEDGFFKYTRDNYWKQDAVGESGHWIEVVGMARWHVRMALFSLESKSNGSATPPFLSGQPPLESSGYSQAPFDPVRDSARENLRS